MKKLSEVLHYYLPYKLMCNAINDEYFEPQLNKELYRIETGRTEKSKIYDYCYIVGDVECTIEDIKPILHPLSSVNKEQFHNFDFVEIMELKEGLRNVQSMHFSTVEICFKNHIDIFGLIESNQALEKQ